MNLHKYTAWTSLWRWWPITFLGDIPKNTFISSTVKAFCARACTTPTSSQTLDDRELALSFSLSPVRYLLFRIGIISSTEVAGEAILVVSVLAPRLDGGLLIHHPHVSSPKIGKRLILLSPHSSVHSLIKFCRHPYKRKTLVKKKIKKKKKSRRISRAAWTNLTITLFFLNLKFS